MEPNNLNKLAMCMTRERQPEEKKPARPVTVTNFSTEKNFSLIIPNIKLFNMNNGRKFFIGEISSFKIQQSFSNLIFVEFIERIPA